MSQGTISTHLPRVLILNHNLKAVWVPRYRVTPPLRWNWRPLIVFH